MTSDFVYDHGVKLPSNREGFCDRNDFIMINNDRRYLRAESKGDINTCEYRATAKECGVMMS